MLFIEQTGKRLQGIPYFANTQEAEQPTIKIPLDLSPTILIFPVSLRKTLNKKILYGVSLHQSNSEGLKNSKPKIHLLTKYIGFP